MTIVGFFSLGTLVFGQIHWHKKLNTSSETTIHMKKITNEETISGEKSKPKVRILFH